MPGPAATKPLLRCVVCGTTTRSDAGLKSHYSQSERCERGYLEELEKLRLPEHSSTRIRRSRSRSQEWRHESVGRLPEDQDAQPPLEDPPRKKTRVTLEEVQDEDFVVEYTVEHHPTAGQTFPQQYTTLWAARREDDAREGREPWAPFASVDEWKLAQWMMTCGISQKEMDRHLKLPTTKLVCPSFKTKRELLKMIDDLPSGPTFSMRKLKMIGDLKDRKGKLITEDLELWMRDPVECIQDLLENAAFRDDIVYRPHRIYTLDKSQTKLRVYNEMWTGNWWWEKQDKLPEGATIAPVILASDKTALSGFSGDKSAYPVYLTIGNIAKSIRRAPSKGATVLLGYLPVPSFKGCSKKKGIRNRKTHEIFHEAMTLLLQPLIDAGTNGTKTVCSDGKKRMVYPLLAAYVADAPEQALVTCTRNNRCPRCTVGPNQRGRNTMSKARSPKESLNYMSLAMQNAASGLTYCEEEGLHAVKPFWANLPECDIFSTITPDILHQLHKGMFKDHLVSWCSELMAKGEMDVRYKSLPDHPALRHFKKGITNIKQWTGTEYKMMERVFVGVIGGSMNDPSAVKAARALLDFIYIAQYPSHTDATIADLRGALDDFHRYKAAFSTDVNPINFNFPKIHSMMHYAEAIVAIGSLDGVNTESPEQLHIDFAKQAYRASNKRNYERQMVRWLIRQEAIKSLDAYITWLRPDAMPVAVGTDSIKIATESSAGDEDGSDDDGNGSDIESDDESDGSEDDDDDDSDSDNESNESDEEQNDQDFMRGSASRLSSAKFNSNTDVLHLRGSDLTKRSTPKRPSWTGVSIKTLTDHFGAWSFLDTLTIFLMDLRQKSTSTVSMPTKNDTFDLYKICYVDINPQEDRGLTPFRDRVRCAPARAAGVFRKLGPVAHFDTVLVKSPKRVPWRWSVARVRAIFDLPTALATYDQPLVYLELFKDLGPSSNEVRMFNVKKMPEQDRRALIAPMSSIIRSCHLIPDLQDDIQAEWDAGEAIEEHTSFFLSDFLDHHLYMLT